MAETTGKNTSANDERGVLGTLSTTRPARLGRERPPASAHGKPKPRAPRPRVAAHAKPKAPPPPPPPRDDRPGGPPSGPELVTTAVQAVGELAQIGFTVGTNVLKRAASRLPRP
jgi:hypothetical protein